VLTKVTDFLTDGDDVMMFASNVLSLTPT